jgi:hypothetical protein
VLQAHGDKDPATLDQLRTVYQSLWEELDLHMHKEELMLFPAIDRYEAAVRSRSPRPPAPFGSIASMVIGRLRVVSSGSGKDRTPD